MHSNKYTSSTIGPTSSPATTSFTPPYQSSSPHQSSTFILRSNPHQLPQSLAREPEKQSSNPFAREKQELLMRILMMNFEIQRKDVVVKNLIRDIQVLEMRTSLSNNQEIFAIREELIKTRRQAQQLQHKVSQLELINNQIQSSKVSAISQLQEQIRTLQHRTKQLQIRKIQVQSELHKLQTENKMLTFKMVNVESSQKGKSREMQNIIIDLEKKAQEQRKVSTELKIIIQSLHEQIRILKDNEHHLYRQFDQKVSSLQKQFTYKDDLKKSQAVSSQQKIQMTQNELLRMQQEVKFLRKKIDDQHFAFQKRQNDMVTQIKRGKQIQAELLRAKHSNQVMRGELDQRVNQVNTLVKELNEGRTAYNALEESRELSSIETTNTFTHQIAVLQQETQTYRQRIVILQQELQKFKTQARKLKRKSQNNINTECTSCKILQSATSIKSNRGINDLNLSEIIQQTERLHDSSLKMEQILSSKRIGGSVMGYDSRMSIDNSFVE